jgi:hypothetical protein
MKRSCKIAIGIELVAGAVFAQSGPYTYTGDIVNAKCLPAVQIVNRNSRGYVPAGVNTFTQSRYKPLHTAAMRKTILRHCAINPGSTEFALLNDQGNFYKLDESGNLQVILGTETTTRRIRMTITGSVDGDTLKVQSLSIVPDKVRSP